MRTAGLLSGLALLAAACAAPAPDDGGQEADGAQPSAEDSVAPDPIPGGDVQPSMDPLDRVDDTCGLEAVKPYLGQPATSIPEALLPALTRILKPDDQATMDYVQERLNVLTREDGTVIGLKCG